MFLFLGQIWGWCSYKQCSYKKKSVYDRTRIKGSLGKIKVSSFNQSLAWKKTSTRQVIIKTREKIMKHGSRETVIRDKIHVYFNFCFFVKPDFINDIRNLANLEIFFVDVVRIKVLILIPSRRNLRCII